MTILFPSLHYTIIVLGSAYGTQQSYLAYQFTEQLLKTSHHIDQVFFYGDGVLNANCHICPANDEFNLTASWQRLAEEYGLSLAFCVSAGMRRGVVAQHNQASGFALSSLTALSEAIANADRVIQF